MGRRDFLAHLEKLGTGCDIAHVSGVRRGDDDMFHFRIAVPVAPEIEESVEIAAMVVPGLSDYPTDHSYQMFLEDENAPNLVASAINSLPNMKGFSLETAITHVAETILSRGRATAKPPSAEKDLDEDYISETSDVLDGFENEDYDSDEDESTFFNKTHPIELPKTNDHMPTPQSSGEEIFIDSEKHLILLDFAAAKVAGFKLARYGNIFCTPLNFHMCLSIRVSKLGISKDAMETWRIEPTEYLVLAFCFKEGYKRVESFMKKSQLVTFRIGLSKTYRPPYNTIVRVFANDIPDSAEWRATFISTPLEEMMNKSFFYILKNRSSGFNWTQAEKLFQLQSGGFDPDQYPGLVEKLQGEADLPRGMYPDVVTRDHVADAIQVINQELSFPLVAMQFFLRHFVRCTEFCLVCHCPLPTAAEAIKPYVCDNPLCLYQYMTLGFGPGIEHEILTQPNVVDLLISFAWSATQARRLKQLPLGLGLMVPSMQLLHLRGEEFSCSRPSFVRQPYGFVVPPPTQLLNKTSVVPIDPYQGYVITFNPQNRQLRFENGGPHNLTSGTWIIIATGFGYNEWSSLHHCRVLKTYPNWVELSLPMMTGDVQNEQAEPISVRVIKYDENFDQLPYHEALASLYLQINLLPSVTEMETYLRGHPARTLATWHSRLSPTAVSVLRWIVASNRACIMEETLNPLVKEMSAMKQFRFAMGAPDKEQRFMSEVTATRQRLGQKHPTILAFHGSPVCNWHGIIREGLHFKDTLHGRAFGHGVYHSLDWNTSASYSSLSSNFSGALTSNWPKSRLMLSSAVALNEIVNAPAEYVSKTPHLVVQNVDWIQTRYLFVTCTIPAGQKKDQENPTTPQPAEEDVVVLEGFAQDPEMPINGPWKRKYNSFMPLRITSHSPRQPHVQSYADMKKRKANELESPAEIEDDNMSVLTLDEDSSIFTDSHVWHTFPQARNMSTRLLALQEAVDIIKHPAKAAAAKAAFYKVKPSSTNFVPGALNHASLTKLPPPQNARGMASKAIMSSLKALEAAMKKESIVELGWFVDLEQVENIFQWIVELHSFPADLPLTKQMVGAKISSVVLEMRFPDNFPFAPPFVRVIRPRFLPFMNGGGGHVTLGGSLCMELLTGTGWSPALSIDNVLTNIIMAITETDPAPAQLASVGETVDYGIQEAIQAYIRACNAHGWAVPDGFNMWMATM